MKHQAKTPTGAASRTSRLQRWLQPRRLAMVAASGVVLGGLFGVLSNTILATAASFNVNETADEALSPSNSTTCVTATSHCSLRAAIQASNNAGGTNVINVPAGTYNLSSSLGELQVGPGGNLTVTINGAGAATTIINAVQPSTCTSTAPSTCFRVFDVDPALHGGVSFSVNGVTIEGGRTGTFGGPAIISGTNSASPFDTTVINNSTIHDNVNYATSTTTGGAVAQDYGSVTVTNSAFDHNGAGGGAGGAIIVELGNATLSVTNSTFDHNTASAEGGAIFIGGSGNDSISGSSFTNNTSTSNSGGVDVGGTATMSISNSTFSGNSGGRGGAVKVSGGTSTLSGDTFTGNSSTGDGGALAVESTATVTGSTFTGNAANSSTGSGGAAFVDGTATATLQYNRLYQNTAHTAAQVFNTGGGTTSAPNNWWGVNAGPGSGIAGFSVSVWQILTSTASPNPILIHQTSTITASTDTTNTSATIAPSHHIPNVAVTFANGTLGTVGSTSGTITSGSATTIYTAGGTGGIDGVPTTADGQTVNGQVTVDEPPHITSANSATFLAGGSVSCSGTLSNCFHVTATGFPAPTFSETGALPAGVTLASNGTLSGSPSTGTGGVYSLTITATNGVSPDDTQTFTLTVNEAPFITSANSTTFTVGSAGTFTVTSRGFPAPTITLTSGSLPSGVSYDSTTHVLSGTPATGTGGQYTLQFTSHNGIGSDSVQTFTLTIHEAPSITSANSTTFTTGTPGTFSITTTGFPAPAIGETGALPSGVTLHDNGTGTATLAGTPGAGTGGTYSITITASNGVTPNATQSFTLTVHQPATITSANHTTFTVGSAGSFTVTTSGFPTVSTLTETGALPGGVSYTDNGDGTGTLSGTPGAGTGGVYSLTFTAHNGIGTDAQQIFTLTVDQAPAITSADNTTFTVGVAGSFTVTTTGVPTASISETGAIPSGVVFTDNGDGTATLAGSPGNGTAGDYTLTITASNGVTPNATQSFTLHVLGTPHITSADNATFLVGTAGSFTVTTTGSQPMTITETGALPGGVSFTDNGDGTATLAGTPVAGTAADYTLTITAANGVPPDATQTFTLHVNEAPAITSADHTTFTVGSAGTFAVTTTGRPTPTLTEIGALPSGVTFTDNGDGTAALAGTPASGSGGTYSLTLTAHNGVGSDATQAFVLTVNQPPAIVSTNQATFLVGSAGSFTVNTTGSQPMTITETGSLPGGVSFTDNGDGTATLSGTPAADTGGIYNLTITASNGVAPDATQSFTLTVNQPAAVISANHTTFTVGTLGSFEVDASGFPVPSLSETGALPAGVTFADNGNGTATLSGTPAAGSGGVYALTITAHNGVGPDGTQPFTLTVGEAPAFTSADHTTFLVGSPGTFSVTTQAFPVATITETGSLPGGVTFTDNGDGTATLSGTPVAGAGGVYSLHLIADNGTTTPASQAFTLTVQEAPSITSANSTTFTVGSAGSFSVTTRGFPLPSLTETGSLPGGLSFTDNGNGTATLAGTPVAGSGGVYPLQLTASNGVPPNAQQTFTLVVEEAPSFTSATHETFVAGSTGSFTVTTRGYPTPDIIETGSLPSGLAFTDNGNGTATLAGTPAPNSGGAYPLSFLATNGNPPDATQSFNLVVDQAPAITSATSTTFVAGSAGSFTVTTTGFPSAAITETGTLPGGVTFHDNGNGTGTLGGTPAAGSGGVYALHFDAVNSVTPSAAQNFVLTVDEAAAITSANTVTFQVGAPGTFTVTTRGFPTPSLTETGSLPGGVTFHDNANGTATLSGTPAGGTSGTYPLSLTAHNGIGPDGTQAFTLIVGAAPTTTTVTGSTTTPTFGQSVTFTATVAPVPPATGTPAGSVTFTVDNLVATVATLSGGHATWTTSNLQVGPHTIGASYGGQPNTFQPSSGTLNVTVGCATTISGTQKNGLTINGGSACISGARVNGGVTISNGASVFIVNSTINNGISSSGAKMLSVCGDTTSVGGSVSVSGTTGFVLIGSNNDDTDTPCSNNNIGGGVTLSGNSGGFELGGNSIKGAVTVNNNVLSGPAPNAENAAPEIEHNTIKGSLSCSGNNPAPTDDLKPNTVSGSRNGQCGAPNF